MRITQAYINSVVMQAKKRADPLRDPKVQQLLQELRNTDRRVRQHELAHKAAGGQYAGPPRYQYVRGPDGRLYAVAGEVRIDTSEGKTPEDTIRKMKQVIRAALAPADPSPQDRRVAALAAQKLMKAEMELLKEQMQQKQESNLPRVNLLV